MITTRKRMRHLCKGDRFYVNGVEHIAAAKSDYCGVADYDDQYVVYDENGEGWFEGDFPESGREAGESLKDMLLRRYTEAIDRFFALDRSHSMDFEDIVRNAVVSEYESLLEEEAGMSRKEVKDFYISRQKKIFDERIASGT